MAETIINITFAGRAPVEARGAIVAPARAAEDIDAIVLVVGGLDVSGKHLLHSLATTALYDLEEGALAVEYLASGAPLIVAGPDGETTLRDGLLLYAPLEGGACAIAFVGADIRRLVGAAQRRVTRLIRLDVR